MTATLANLVVNDNGLRVFCDRCGRCVDLNVSVLVERHGSAMPLPEIGRRSRCTACGEKGGSVQVVAVRWRYGRHLALTGRRWSPSHKN